MMRASRSYNVKRVDCVPWSSAPTHSICGANARFCYHRAKRVMSTRSMRSLCTNLYLQAHWPPGELRACGKWTIGLHLKTLFEIRLPAL